MIFVHHQMVRVFIHPGGVALPPARLSHPSTKLKKSLLFCLIEKPIVADIEYYALGCNSCFTFPGWHLYVTVATVLIDLLILS